MDGQQRLEHARLEHGYGVWFSRRAPGKQTNYDSTLKLVAEFKSVGQFWSVYSHLARPDQMNGHCDLHVFKHGIRPLWEDSANQAGGKWIVRLRKGLASRCWENLLLALIGEQFVVGDDVCGVVCSVRFQEDILSVWNRSADDTHTTLRIRDTLRRVLNLPAQTVMEYKTHVDSLRDNSSFRNTNLVR